MTIKAHRGRSIAVDGQHSTPLGAAAECQQAPSARTRIAVSITPLALEADSRAFKVAMSLKRFGYRSIVLEGATSAADFTKSGLEVRALSARTAISGAKRESISRLRSGRAGRLGYFLLFGAFWLRFAWRYVLLPFARLPRADLYYVHSYEYLPLCLATRRGARCIYDAHDFYQDIVPSDEQPEFDQKYLMPSLGGLERAVARRCDAVVTVSQGVAAALRDTMTVQPIVVTNSADRRANRPADSDIRAVIGLGADQRLLVMVGNYKKGIPFSFVSEMVRELPSYIHVAFVGRGYEAAERNARAAGLAGQLHFPSARAPFEVTSFIATADAGLLLYRIISRNYRSALPNGFFHLLDAGLPIARFALPEVEALISQAQIGPLLDPDDPSRAARTIADFLESAEMIEARAAVSALADAVAWEAQERTLWSVADPARTELSALHA